MESAFERSSYQGSFQDLTECWKIQMFLESTSKVNIDIKKSKIIKNEVVIY